MLKVDLIATFVDDHLVVKPAQDDEVVLVGFSTLGPWGEVVYLETMC